MTIREIQCFQAEQYGTEMSPKFISSVTDAVMAAVTTWQSRPLEPMYPVVFFGARVTVADAEGNENTYTIVGVDEADVARGRISWISPLARALIKSREGNSIRFQSPVGILEIDIVEVAYERIE
jgi:transcription elongation GreA/GreB family factor